MLNLLDDYQLYEEFSHLNSVIEEKSLLSIMSQFYCLPSGVARAGNYLIIIQETTAWQVSWKQKMLINKIRDYSLHCILT